MMKTVRGNGVRGHARETETQKQETAAETSAPFRLQTHAERHSQLELKMLTKCRAFTDTCTEKGMCFKC